MTGPLGNNRPSDLRALRRDPLFAGSRPVLGIPNEGRLHHMVRNLVRLPRGVKESRALVFEKSPWVVHCARSADLPSLLAVGLVDAIVTGYDYVVDSGHELETLWLLPTRGTRIDVLRRRGDRPISGHETPIVVSQYHGIGRRYADSIGANFVAIAGASEGYVRLGSADLAVDAIASGETAYANDLESVKTLFTSKPGVFGSRTRPLAPRERKLLEGWLLPR